MKRLSVISLLAVMLLLPQPAQATGWLEEVAEWFEEWFEEAPVVEEQPLSAADIDSLRSSPLGLILNEIPGSDTLAVADNWPLLSSDVSAELERYNRLLRHTVLLTDPAGKLPLSATAVRVIYKAEQRPGKFIDLLRRYADVQEVVWSNQLPEVLAVSPELPTIIVADDGQAFRKSGAWYDALATSLNTATSLVHFGEAALIAGVPSTWSVINCPLRSRESESFLAQALFGAELIDGRLPLTTPTYASGTGYRLSPVRSGFRLPEQLGIDRAKFERLDYEINRGVRYRAMPGAQMLVMKGGHVVYEKAYGHHTYRKQAVTNGDLYDLASVTKVAATTLAVMKLYETGQLELKKRVRDYLPEYKRKVVGRYTIEQLLSHQTGLQPNIPINAFLGKQFVADAPSETHQHAVGPGKWLDSRVPGWVKESLAGKIDRTRSPIFKYSDLNFYLLQLVVEAVTKTTLDQYVTTNFYAPMGLDKLAYKPKDKYPEARLVPTVRDNWMRGGLLRGHVHDEGAALLGGVGGHAGLFGNAYDLGQLFQLLNNGGTYAGRNYLAEETVNRFTARNGYNYRGLGFDRLTGRWNNAATHGAGDGTVGHLGFTGTSVWADAENDLVYVLLTNRVNPDPTNVRFRKYDIRSRVSRAVYQSLNTYELDL